MSELVSRKKCVAISDLIGSYHFHGKLTKYDFQWYLFFGQFQTFSRNFFSPSDFTWSDRQMAKIIRMWEVTVIWKKWRHFFLVMSRWPKPVWKLRELSLTHFWQKFHKSNAFMKSVTNQLIWRNTGWPKSKSNTFWL